MGLTSVGAMPHNGYMMNQTDTLRPTRAEAEADERYLNPTPRNRRAEAAWEREYQAWALARAEAVHGPIADDPWA